MTISIQVSVNGNYKVPVTVQHGNAPSHTEVISGKGLVGPKIYNINHYHGPSNITRVAVGPEEPDNE